jgi:Putative prokaryotic signal transducing protein
VASGGRAPLMKRLVQAPNIALASLWVDLLRQAGLDASVQRWYASGIAGEIPPDQALPEVWVHDDELLEKARTLLRDFQRPAWRHWVCPACSERIDGPFEQCWNCGSAMPA